MKTLNIDKLTEEKKRIITLMGVTSINESFNPKTVWSLFKTLGEDVLDSPKLYDEYFAAGKMMDNEISKSVNGNTLSADNALKLRSLFKQSSVDLGKIIKNSTNLDDFITKLAANTTDPALKVVTKVLKTVITPLADDVILKLTKELWQAAGKASDKFKEILDKGGTEFLNTFLGKDGKITFIELQTQFRNYLINKGITQNGPLDYLTEAFLESSYLKSWLRKNKMALDPTDINMPDPLKKILTGDEKLTAQESIIDAINEWKILKAAGATTNPGNISTFKTLMSGWFPGIESRFEFLFDWIPVDKSAMTEKFANNLMASIDDFVTFKAKGAGQTAASKESGLAQLQYDFFDLSGGWKVGDELNYKATWDNLKKTIKEGKTYEEQKFIDDYFTSFEGTSTGVGSNPFKDLIEDAALRENKEGFGPKLYYDLFSSYTTKNSNAVGEIVKNKVVAWLKSVAMPALRFLATGMLQSPAKLRRFFILRGYTKSSYIAWFAYRILVTKLAIPLVVGFVKWVAWLVLVGFNFQEKEGRTLGLGIVWDELVKEWTFNYGDFHSLLVSLIPGYLDDIGLWIFNLSVTKDEVNDPDKLLDDTKNKLKIPDDADQFVKDQIEKAQKTVEYQQDKKRIEDNLKAWASDVDYSYITKNLMYDTSTLSFYIEDPSNKAIKYFMNNNGGNTDLQVNGIVNGKKLMWVKNEDSKEKAQSQGTLKDFVIYINKLKPVKAESRYKKTNNMITERNKEKFGEDNFKHWKDTFTFKAQDEKNPGQYKEVKIKMEDVMDRINHYRKKYDEDDSFVRAVIDTHEDVVKIMFTKDLANIHESATPRGLALVLRTIKESRGEMEIFSVARPANGNWFLVKGDYTPNQLANMDLEKKEPRTKETEVNSKSEDDLKKKEESAINVLKRNEKEGIEDLPKKVRDKVREKMGKGWTTEIPPEELKEYFTTSEINSIFNDKIVIYKLEPTREFFNSLVKYSARIVIKRGFCRTLKSGRNEFELSERQKMTVNHILNKCNTKYESKLGLRNF